MGKPEGKTPLGRPSHGWEIIIKMCFQLVGWGSMDWIRMAYKAAERGVWTLVKKLFRAP